MFICAPCGRPFIGNSTNGRPCAFALWASSVALCSQRLRPDVGVTKQRQEHGGFREVEHEYHAACASAADDDPPRPRGLTMCGVIGYVGRRAAMDRLLHGLERLEYRGYDSSGICLIGASGLERG